MLLMEVTIISDKLEKIKMFFSGGSISKTVIHVIDNVY